MPASETIRHRIYEAFRKSHGEEVAADMLEVLPPAGLPDLATKDDVALLRSDLCGEIGQVRSELRGEIGRVRADMSTMEARLLLEIAERSSHSLRVIVAVVAVATAVLGLLITLV